MSTNENIDNINDIDEKMTEETKQKVVVFCIPGKSFTSRFLVGWSELLLQCLVNNYRPILCQENDRNIFIQRNKCLGGNILEGSKDQKPFRGQLEYDYIVWIDPNVIFTFKDLQKLLNSNYDVTSGVYTLNPVNNITNVVKELDYKFYKENGTFKFLSKEEIIKMDKIDNRYFEADFVDLGWTCIKKEISEKIEYPWFSVDDEEDVALFTDCYSYCKKLKKNGVKIMIDSNIMLDYSEV